MTEQGLKSGDAPLKDTPLRVLAFLTLCVGIFAAVVVILAGPKIEGTVGPGLNAVIAPIAYGYGLSLAVSAWIAFFLLNRFAEVVENSRAMARQLLARSAGENPDKR